METKNDITEDYDDIKIQGIALSYKKRLKCNSILNKANNRNQTTDGNKKLFKFYQKTNLIRILFFVFYSLFNFFELPFWCYNEQVKIY